MPRVEVGKWSGALSAAMRNGCKEDAEHCMARMRTPPFQDSKLLAESEILQEEIAARTKEHDNRNRQQLHQAQHARSCTQRQSGLDTGRSSS
jgi:hypothetical protein